MTIVDFLLARIAEREAVARAATPGPWYWEKPSEHDWAMHDQSLMSRGKQDAGYDATVLYASGYDASCIEGEQVDRDHIALNDPAAVLARCAVDRRIAALHTPERTARAEVEGTDYKSCPICDPHPPIEEPDPGACATLRLMASLDADHPDYDESWKP